jgi:predicted nuclease of predicted toxin-antitoxin system
MNSDFRGEPTSILYLWAQKNNTIIVTYDEDFADARFYPLGEHHGIIRLRVWPTTIEQTQSAMDRLIIDVPPKIWRNSLIIIDNSKIRVRRLR